MAVKEVDVIRLMEMMREGFTTLQENQVYTHHRIDGLQEDIGRLALLFGSELESLRNYTDTRFDAVNIRLDAMDTRFDQVMQKLSQMASDITDI